MKTGFKRVVRDLFLACLLKKMVLTNAYTVNRAGKIISSVRKKRAKRSAYATARILLSIGSMKLAPGTPYSLNSLFSQ